jgi:hypothetical protein
MILSFILPGYEVVVDSWYNDVRAPHRVDGAQGTRQLTAGLAVLKMECVRLRYFTQGA